MIEPQAASFHGDLTRVCNPSRAAPEDPEVAAAIREAERIIQEAHRCRAVLHRAGPNILGLRPMGR